MTAAVGGRQPAAGKRTSGWAGPLYRPAAFRGTGPQNLGGRATRGRAGGIRAAGAGTLIGNLSRQDRRQTNRYKYRFGAKSTTPVSRRSRSLPELSHLVGGPCRQSWPGSSHRHLPLGSSPPWTPPSRRSGGTCMSRRTRTSPSCGNVGN